MPQWQGYKPGDWNATCFQCGRKHKASQLMRHWQGYWVCSACYEPRHTQDFVKGTKDNPTVPFVQPQWGQDIDIGFCTIDSRSAFPGRAKPGCMVPGNDIYDLSGDSPTLGNL
jgi:hypothetical protein